MKSQIRILGIDDGPFNFSDKQVPVVGVIMRLPNYIEAVMVSSVTVDGADATDRVLAMLGDSRYLEQVKVIMLDGAALGGFNVVDIRRLHEELAIPVITVTRDRPDYEEIEKALRKHFEDWQERLRILRQAEPREFGTGHNPVWVGSIGMDPVEIAGLLELATVRGALPEALRVAHLIASAIARGESRGRA